MAYCGDAGLVTEGTSDLVLMSCTAPVHACGDCFRVRGGGGTRVASFAALPGATATYQLGVTWDAGYRGSWWWTPVRRGVCVVW